MCAISPTEIPRLILEYPVVFTQHGETKEFLLVSLFGVDPQRNLFWREEKWQSFAVPLNVGRQPFFLEARSNTENAETTQRLVACIDLDNPGVQESTGERLFDEEGNETPYLKHKMSVLSELVDGERRGRAFTDRINALGLIKPVQLELKEPGAAPRKIGGLFSIDELKLRALPSETIVELNSNGYLHVIHAMLLSLGQFAILARRASNS